MNWPTLPGFSSVEQTGAMCAYAISPDLSFENAMGLMQWLPDDCELNFYDKYYPSSSDPGAFISIKKRSGVLTYRMANHGWSSDPEKQSAEFLASLLYLNRETSAPFSARTDHLSVRRVSRY